MGADYKHAKRQQFLGATFENLNGVGGIEYFPVVGRSASMANIWDAEHIPGRQGILHFAYIILSVAPGAVPSRTFTLYLNGVPTPIVIVITGLGVTQGINLVNAVAVGPFDEICWHSDGGVGGPGASLAYASIGFIPY